MNQLKVFEFAKELGVETLALMDKIREWKLPVRSHMATLDEEMMAEIRSRLEQAKEAAKPKKKTTTRKKATGEKAAKPSTTKAKTSTTGTTVIAKKSAGGTAPVVRSKVIRRKAGEAEVKPAEPEIQEAAETREPIVEGETTTPPTQAAGAAPSGAAETETTAAAGAATTTQQEPPKRRNIVGRMDLRRVAAIQPSTPSGGPSPRVSRTSPRNIRTGFFSADAMVMPEEPTFETETREQREERVKKKPGALREEENTVFTATEFRKREVIFQPKKKKVITNREARRTQITTPAAHKRIVKVEGSITVQNLALEMGIKAPALIKKLMQMGMMANVNTELDFDTVALVVPEFGWEAQNVQKTVDELLDEAAFGNLDAEKVVRPPVVTVMGHVDHGKTSLLDSIRKTRVAAGEAGGITQHIGAYSVELEDGRTITFIDTPGHEAFTAMRARGANVTDIAIIVVAADDGVMPQTVEAINHAKAANVPIIVAINKMDKPSANPDRIKQQLTEYELVPEEWGGTTIFVPVSALKGTGIKELLEQILLVAEISELKANPERSGTGIVIESRVEKGRGCVASLLVQDGSVKIGQTLVAGKVVGRVRSMINDQGKNVSVATPGMPVEILGLPEPPMAGDRFDITKDEEIAQKIAEQRKAAEAKEEIPSAKMSLDQLFAKVKSGDVKELSLVLKADVAGSLEAVKGMLDKLGTEEVKLKLIHNAVGGITESDVLLASTAKGVIVGFNVRPDTSAMRLAKEKGVEIKTYSIIYELVDDLKKALSGLLSPEVVEKVMGRAEVRNTFNVPKMGTVAGCFVTDGKVARNHMLRLVRDGRVIYEGKVGSLRRFKDDVREVAAGFECGLGIENFNDIKVGDVIEAFIKEEHTREL